MTEDQLAAIEARHHSAQWTLTPSSQISTCHAIIDPKRVKEHEAYE